MTISENISLKPYNTFGIDAEAKFFTSIQSIQNIQELLQSHEYKKHPISIFTSMTKIQWVMPITTYDIQWVYTSSFRKYTFPLTVPKINSWLLSSIISIILFSTKPPRSFIESNLSFS